MPDYSHLVGLLAEQDLSALALFRDRDWLLARSAEGFFVQIPAEEEKSAFDSLPFTNRWLQKENLLFPFHAHLPERALPSESWQPLATVLPFQKPPSALLGLSPSCLSVTLEISSTYHPSTAVLTSQKAAQFWLEKAFSFRLAPLRFAFSESQELLILGSPLPPLTGILLYQIGKLLIPSGLGLPAYLHHLDLEEALHLREDQIALLGKDSAEVILEEQFLPATRANFRTSFRYAEHHYH